MKTCDVKTLVDNVHVHYPNNELVKFGSKIYKYNSLGFRGEEFRPDAKFRVAAFGCSITFGDALNIEETYLYKLKCLIAEALDIDANDVNMLNFAVGGHSNDYITRSVLNYAEPSDADAVLYAITHLPRTEFVDKDGSRNFNIGSITLNRIDEITDEKLLAFFDFYEPEMGFINAMKNLTLAQYHMKLKGIPNLVVNATIDIDAFRQNPYCADFIAKIDFENYTTHHFVRYKADLAADNNHAGPIANTAIAIHLLKDLGELLVRHGRVGEGRKMIEKSLVLRTSSAEYLFCSGIIDDRLHEAPKEAIKKIRRSIEIDPSFTEFHIYLGNLLLAAGNKEAAMRAYENALDVDADDGKVHHALGELLGNMGKNQLGSALRHALTAIELDAENADYRYLACKLLLKANRIAEAEIEAKRAIELRPRYAGAYNKLSSIFRAQDRLDEALACVKRALEIKPNNANFLNQLAELNAAKSARQQSV